jgi:hypothetical protein
MIRQLKAGQYQLYSRKVDPKTGKRRNLGTFKTREEAVQHGRAVQFFERRREAWTEAIRGACGSRRRARFRSRDTTERSLDV